MRILMRSIYMSGCIVFLWALLIPAFVMSTFSVVKLIEDSTATLRAEDICGEWDAEGHIIRYDKTVAHLGLTYTLDVERTTPGFLGSFNSTIADGTGMFAVQKMPRGWEMILVDDDDDTIHTCQANGKTQWRCFVAETNKANQNESLAGSLVLKLKTSEPCSVSG